MKRAELESASPAYEFPLEEEIRGMNSKREKPRAFARVDTLESNGNHEARIIDLRSKSDSTWLRNHMIWCVFHNAQVVISQSAH